MLIGGLWHGANFTFVIWGAYHGGLLVIEKFFQGKIPFKLNSYIQVFMTFILVNIGWVFFRSDHVSDAILWLKKIFIINENFTWTTLNIITKYKDRFYFALALGLILIFVSPNTFEIRSKLNQKKYVFLLAVLFITSLLFLNDESPFLYFQF
jgi:alginate O-acetyltransferase complex protein AlgI